MNKKYELQVKREILVTVDIEAESPEQALQRYQEGDFVGEEDVLDSSDIGNVSIKEILNDNDEDEYEDVLLTGGCIAGSKTCKMPVIKQ